MFGIGEKDKESGKQEASQNLPGTGGTDAGKGNESDKQQASQVPSGTGGEKKEDEKPKEQQPAAGKKEPAKTTPDEGKTFNTDTVFVCVQDCFQKGTRRRRGDELTGKVCPPWFIVKPKVPEADKDKK